MPYCLSLSDQRLYARVMQLKTDIQMAISDTGAAMKREHRNCLYAKTLVGEELQFRRYLLPLCRQMLFQRDCRPAFIRSHALNRDCRISKHCIGLRWLLL
jgi:hypothetical protein